MPLTHEIKTGTDFEGNKWTTFEWQQFFIPFETLNKEWVLGKHQCPVLAGLGCILIVIVFVSEGLPLFERHSANRAGREYSHPSFVYLGWNLGMFQWKKCCLTHKPAPLACSWTTWKPTVKTAVQPHNSALQNYCKQIFHKSGKWMSWPKKPLNTRTWEPFQPLVPNLPVGISELPEIVTMKCCIHKDVKYSVTVSEKATFLPKMATKIGC